MIKWFLDQLVILKLAKNETLHVGEHFFRNGYKERNHNTVCFRHVYMNFVFNWVSYVYSAAFLLLLLSEVLCSTDRGFGLHDIYVKIKCSLLYKYCFPIHLWGKPNLVLMMLQFVAMKIIWVLQALYSDFLFIIRPMGNDRLFYHI